LKTFVSADLLDIIFGGTSPWHWL